MGWKDREYHREQEPKELLSADAIVGVTARILGSGVLLLPLVTVLTLGARAAGWLGDAEGPRAALTAFFAALALAAISAIVAIAERWLATLPVKQLDHAALAGTFVAVASGLLLAVALRQLVFAVVSVTQGSPVFGLEDALHPRFAANAAWLADPVSITCFAVPFGVLAAVRGDEDDRPLRRELELVTLLALGVTLLLAFAFWLLGMSRVPAPTYAARIAVALVVPPLIAVALSLGARLGDVIAKRLATWLQLDA